MRAALLGKISGRMDADALSTLSVSIGFYRPLATHFDGGTDGKIDTRRREVVCFQMLTGAGDD
jgi:hypothetical protein